MERAFVKASRGRKKFMICHFGTRQMRWSRKLMTFGPLLMNRSVSDIYVYIHLQSLEQELSGTDAFKCFHGASELTVY